MHINNILNIKTLKFNIRNNNDSSIKTTFKNYNKLIDFHQSKSIDFNSYGVYKLTHTFYKFYIRNSAATNGRAMGAWHPMWDPEQVNMRPPNKWILI